MHARILYSSSHTDQDPVAAEQELRRFEGVYIGILGGIRRVASDKSITIREADYRVSDVQAFTAYGQPGRRSYAHSGSNVAHPAIGQFLGTRGSTKYSITRQGVQFIRVCAAAQRKGYYPVCKIGSGRGTQFHSPVVAPT